MFCENCKIKIQSDSKLCEFCGEKDRNSNKSSAFKRSGKELDLLKSKPWYRFLKVIYSLLFIISILLLITKIDLGSTREISKKVVYGKNTIVCDNGSQYPLSDFKDVFVENSTYADYDYLLQSRDKNARLKQVCLTGTTSLNNNINYYYDNVPINFELTFENITLWEEIFKSWILPIFLHIFYLACITIIFEMLRQLGYYIFLGKIYQSWLINKLFNLEKNKIDPMPSKNEMIESKNISSDWGDAITMTIWLVTALIITIIQYNKAGFTTIKDPVSLLHFLAGLLGTFIGAVFPGIILGAILSGIAYAITRDSDKAFKLSIITAIMINVLIISWL